MRVRQLGQCPLCPSSSIHRKRVNITSGEVPKDKAGQEDVTGGRTVLDDAKEREAGVWVTEGQGCR